MYTFRAMNTDVAVTAAGDEAAIAARVAETFADAERRFSRFRTDSELAALNRAAGPMVVSDAMFAALSRARTYVELTGGLFDPAIGGALTALGYDRSFAPGALDRAAPGPRPQPGRFLDVALDPMTHEVTRPPHVQIDLGGIAKGGTVDLAARHLTGGGAVDAGGDAVMRSSATTDDTWLVEVEDPAAASRVLAVVAVHDGAVATTADNRRRWRVGKRAAHHLIDPRTQEPAMSDLAQVTVFAGTAERADVLAKTAFLLGVRRGYRFLTGLPGVGAVLVPRGGAPLVVGALDLREVARG